MSWNWKHDSSFRKSIFIKICKTWSSCNGIYNQWIPTTAAFSECATSTRKKMTKFGYDTSVPVKPTGRREKEERAYLHTGCVLCWPATGWGQTSPPMTNFLSKLKQRRDIDEKNQGALSRMKLASSSKISGKSSSEKFEKMTFYWRYTILGQNGKYSRVSRT